jgi:DNA-binding SARP family transcriptional activator
MDPTTLESFASIDPRLRALDVLERARALVERPADEGVARALARLSDVDDRVVAEALCALERISGSLVRARPEIELGPALDWVRVPSGEVVRLARRRPLKRLLRRLVDAHAAETGRSLSLDALVGAGWPGERIHRAAARNRLHNALSTLRKMGFSEVLRSRHDGYLLDPATVVIETATGSHEPPCAA